MKITLFTEAVEIRNRIGDICEKILEMERIKNVNGTKDCLKFFVGKESVSPSYLSMNDPSPRLQDNISKCTTAYIDSLIQTLENHKEFLEKEFDDL